MTGRRALVRPYHGHGTVELPELSCGRQAGTPTVRNPIFNINYSVGTAGDKNV